MQNPKIKITHESQVRKKSATVQRVYSITCGCGRSYISETGGPLVVRLHKHGHNFKQCLLENSKLFQHAYNEGHRVSWDEDSILRIQSNSRYMKYKESAHMACLTNPITLGISPIWNPLINNEITS
jgi:hypothetical protein